MSEPGPLSAQMRQLAQRMPQFATILIEHADAMDKAIAAWTETGEKTAMKRMLGSWARARRLYCEISGEPLI